MIDYSDTQQVIEECFGYLDKSSRERMDTEQADKVAALFLVAQMKLAIHLQDVEMLSRQSKNNIERVEGEKYFEFKNSSGDKKITADMLSSMVAKDADVVKAKNDFTKNESDLKKYTHVLNVLKDGHLFYRNASKTKQWSE
jgi:hypothetical protein